MDTRQRNWQAEKRLEKTFKQLLDFSRCWLKWILENSSSTRKVKRGRRKKGKKTPEVITLKRFLELYIDWVRSNNDFKFTRSMASTGPLNFQILPLSQHLKPSKLKSSVYANTEVKLEKSCMRIFVFGSNEPLEACKPFYKVKVVHGNSSKIYRSYSISLLDYKACSHLQNILSSYMFVTLH